MSLTVDFDAALVAELERAARARLEPIAAIARDVNTFALRTEGSDSACLDAIERLRRDSRVRSVEVDVRRELHAP